MAGIDKIYGNKDQFIQLYNWCLEHRSEIKKKLRLDIIKGLYYSTPDNFPQIENELALSSFSQNIDSYLWDNCNLDFVKERLKVQYNNSKPEIQKKYTVDWIDENNKWNTKYFDKIKECFDFIDTLNENITGNISSLWSYPLIDFWYDEEQKSRVWDSNKLSCIRLLFGKDELK